MKKKIKFVWKCLVCEKEMVVHHEDLNKGILPNIEGGTMDLHFGYPSKFDEIVGLAYGKNKRWQACICDECFEQKKRLCRIIKVTHSTKWEIVDQEKLWNERM